MVIWRKMIRLVRSTVLRTTWIVPRNIICVIFWLGVIIVFIGMILLVTSKHKGSAFLYGGVTLLVLGLCIILTCFGLCMHAYFVLATTIDQEDFKSRCEFKKPLQTITINSNDLEIKPKTKPMMVMPPKFKPMNVTKPSLELREDTCFMTIPHANLKPPRVCPQGTIYENEINLHSMRAESDESVDGIIEGLKKPSAQKNNSKINIIVKPLHELKEIPKRKNKMDDRGRSFKENSKPKTRRKIDTRASSFEDNDVSYTADEIIKPDEKNESKATVYDNVYHL